MHDQGNVADEAAQYRRAHVLPRVSAMLSEAVLQAAPFEEAQKPVTWPNTHAYNYITNTNWVQVFFLAC